MREGVEEEALERLQGLGFDLSERPGALSPSPHATSSLQILTHTVTQSVPNTAFLAAVSSKITVQL